MTVTCVLFVIFVCALYRKGWYTHCRQCNHFQECLIPQGGVVEIYRKGTLFCYFSLGDMLLFHDVALFVLDNISLLMESCGIQTNQFL